MAENQGESKYAKAFNPSEIKHHRIERFKPQFAGVGGEHVVYKFPEYPDKVAKVDGIYLLQLVENASAGKNPPPESLIERLLEKEQARVATLKRYFGEKHVPETSFHYWKVPIDNDRLVEAYKLYGKASDVDSSVVNYRGNEIRSVVKLQDTIPELSDPARLALRSGYSERVTPTADSNYRQAYIDLTREAVLTVDGLGTVYSGDITEAQPHMKALVDKARYDIKLQLALKGFVKNAIRYSVETGETLDLAGPDNVIFYRNEKGWDYKMVDAIYPSPPPPEGRISESQSIVSKVAAEGPGSLEHHEQGRLMNSLNYVRTINGLANWLEIEDRINIMPDGVRVDALTLYDAAKPRK